MKFSSCTLLAVLAMASHDRSTTTEAFSSWSSPVYYGRIHQSSSSSLYSATAETTEESSSSGAGTNISAMSRKKEDRLNFMKSKQFHRRGFKEVRGKVENDIQEQYQSELVNTLKTSNYMIDRPEEGVRVYLAKDFGFCWGVERSIALAYEAVEHYPDRTLHITNELIHNPEVNDRLASMKVNMIEKVGTGQKDFSTVKEGDVVILPAFGASYEEMELLDKKVSFQSSHARL